MEYGNKIMSAPHLNVSREITDTVQQLIFMVINFRNFTATNIFTDQDDV